MTSADSNPFVVMIAGPNGSGKSTLTRHLIERGVDFGLYINPDDIAARLVGSYDERVQQARLIADEMRAKAIAERQNFSFETVMSHPSKLDVLRQARDAGFRVGMFFVATSNPDINVDRVANRVASGGHDVAEDKIRARYARTLELAKEAVMLCDDAVFFDNSQTLRALFEVRRSDNSVTLEVADARNLPDWALKICSRVDSYLRRQKIIDERSFMTVKLED